MRIEKSFASLLSLTLSGLDPQQAKTGLVGRLTQLIQGLEQDYRPDPEDLAIWVESVQNQLACVQYSDPPAKAVSWKKLLNAFHDRWPAWDDAHPWGWHALSLAARQGDGPTVLRFLKMPGAPSPQELSVRILPRFRKYPEPAQIQPAGAYTLLGVFLQRAQPDDYPLVHKLLEEGVSPNAPCAPGAVPPLLLASSPVHITLLENAGATFQLDPQVPLAWLDPGQSRRPQAIQALDAQLEAWNTYLDRGPKTPLFTQVKAHVRELVDQAGAFVAGRPKKEGGSDRAYVPSRLLHEIGRKVGVDIGQPGPSGPSLLGAFSRGQLRAATVHATLRTARGGVAEAERAYDLLPRHAIAENDPWQGMAGGRPASVWGYLANLAFANRGQGAACFPEACVPGNPIPASWWEHAAGAFGELRSTSPERPDAPIRWKLLGNMVPALDKHGQMDRWLAFYQQELEWVVAMQKADQGSTPGAPRPPAHALLNEPPSSNAWKAWPKMLEALAKTMAKNGPGKHSEVAHLLLEAATLQGSIHHACFATLAAQLQSDLDVPRLLAARDSLAQSGRIKMPDNHEWREFWLQVELPAARPARPPVRL